MNLLKRILRWLGVVLEVELAGVCVVCGHGPSPALGVPIATIDGTWKHLVCMMLGLQIGEAAEQAKVQPPALAPQAQQPRPFILAIVRPAGRESWN
jgi:hypothetical protein